MKRCAYGQHHGALGAFGFGDFAGALDSCLRSRNDDLPRRVVIRHHADAAFGCRFRGRGFRAFDIDAEQRTHRAVAHQHRGLHSTATCLQKPRCICERERTHGRQRRIFAQRMAGHEARMTRQIERAFAFEHADDSEARGHDRGLCIFGENKIGFGAFPHQPGKLLVDGFVNFFEHLARDAKRLGQPAAHTDGLAALSRKNERAHHAARDVLGARDSRKGDRIIVDHDRARADSFLSPPFNGCWAQRRARPSGRLAPE
jgi:hypothetical protein